jgi:hypothetical protein
MRVSNEVYERVLFLRDMTPGVTSMSEAVQLLLEEAGWM